MLALLLASIMGITATCHDHECADGLSLSIDISATIMASTTVALDMKPTSIAGMYKLDIEYELYHQDKVGQYRESHLVIDSGNKLKSEMIVADLDTDTPRIDLNVPLTVLAVRWPEGMSEKEVLAFYEISGHTIASARW